MPFEPRFFPEGVLCARIDQLTTYQDYPPYDLCIRLIGVDTHSFLNAEFNDVNGCHTYLIDINLIREPVAQAWGGYQPFSDSHVGYGLYKRFGDLAANSWVCIRYSLATTPTNSYGYALFQDAAPTYLHIQSIDFMGGPVIEAVSGDPHDVDFGEIAPSAPQKLTGFHVGQGMCSVLRAGERSYLLDAGAGTPVKREAYHWGTHAHTGPFTSDLMGVLGTSSIHMVLSHPDSDHWRLLDWDAGLLAQIERIYVPDEVADLFLCDQAIKQLIIPTKSLQVSDPDNHIFLQAYRSEPIVDDSNGQCLVSVVTIGADRALVPGDYIYSRMVIDTNSDISCLMTQQFDTVIVPHHGDRHSANDIVTPATPGKSVAFFSAGNHGGYHHPRSESLSGHHEATFDVVSKKWVDNIVAVDLL